MFQLVATGTLRAQFDTSSKIDLLEMTTTEHVEYLPRSQLVQAAAEASDIKQSPNASKSQGKRGSQQRQQKQPSQTSQDQIPQVPIPESIVTEYGTTKEIFQFLEVSH